MNVSETRARQNLLGSRFGAIFVVVATLWGAIGTLRVGEAQPSAKRLPEDVLFLDREKLESARPKRLAVIIVNTYKSLPALNAGARNASQWIETKLERPYVPSFGNPRGDTRMSMGDARQAVVQHIRNSGFVPVLIKNKTDATIGALMDGVKGAEAFLIVDITRDRIKEDTWQRKLTMIVEVSAVLFSRDREVLLAAKAEEEEALPAMMLGDKYVYSPGHYYATLARGLKAFLDTSVLAPMRDARPETPRRVPDQGAIAAVALDSLVLRERIVAVVMLSDEKLLAAVAAGDQTLAGHRVGTLQRFVVPPSMRAAKEQADLQVGRRAVEKITNEALLEMVALTTENRLVGVQAAEKLTDQERLKTVALRASSASVRSAAVAKLTEKAVLARIAKEDKEATVRQQAAERLAELAPPARGTEETPQD